MAASTGDKITDIRNAGRPNSARVSSGRSAGGTTLACDNLTGWPTASKVHFVTYQIDSTSTPVAGTQLDCTGIVSGNNIGSMVVVDGTDTGNSVNDVVEMLPTAAWGQDLADALTAQHTRTGTHKSITNTGGLTTDTITVSGAATLSGGTTLAAGDIGTADIATGAVTAPLLATSAITLGYAEITSDFTTATSAADVDVTNLTTTVTVPAGGRRCRITAWARSINSSGNIINLQISIKEGATQLSQNYVTQAATAYQCTAHVVYSAVLSAGSHTYKVAVQSNAAGTITLSAGATYPAFILVEAI